MRYPSPYLARGTGLQYPLPEGKGSVLPIFYQIGEKLHANSGGIILTFPLSMVTGVRLKEKCKTVAEKITGVAHPHRIAILYLLSHESLAMHEIAENIDLPANLVSHHLDQLLSAGWIKKIKEGKTVRYELKKRPFTEINKFVLDTPYGLKHFS